MLKKARKYTALLSVEWFFYCGWSQKTYSGECFLQKRLFFLGEYDIINLENCATPVYGRCDNIIATEKIRQNGESEIWLKRKD